MRNPFGKKASSSLRHSAVFRSARSRRRLQLRVSWRRALALFAALAAALSLVGAWLYFDLQQDLRRRLNAVTPPEMVGGAERPYNALLVGSDSRRGLTAEERDRLGAHRVRGERADTLILAHFDPRSERVTMVQFPRDLYVTLADGRKDRINMALERGANFLTRTVEALTGLDVNRYAQVNISGFRDIVDAIGGVSVCITEPIPFDSQTGLEIKPSELGMVHFDGNAALRFVRSRKTLPGGDFDRIRNQQKFLAAAIDKVTSAGTFLNPNRIRKLKNHVGDNVIVDSGTSLGALVKLARRFESVNSRSYEAYTVPNLGPATVAGASVVLAHEPAMRLLFDALEDNKSPARADAVPDISPATVRVGVYNATGIDGQAESAARKLVAATNSSNGAVRIAELGTATGPLRENTLIRYRPSSKKQAGLLAAVLPGAKLAEGKTERGVDVAVLVGNRFKTKRLVQILPIPLPTISRLPAECRR